MKKFLLLAMTLTLATSAFAQRGGYDQGSITLRDGRSVVRINVGDDRDDREMLQRVRRLEQAVRDLQDKVYDLQSQPRPSSKIVVCSANLFHVGIVIGKASTEMEAKANALSECERKGGGIFCEEKKLKCETSF